jgi:hypothetical protein
MIRSVRASLAALAATAILSGCTADEGTGPTPSIASIVAHLDSVVIAARARGDTVQADFMTAIETPLVFGAPLSFVQVALDTFEVQGTHEMNTVAWDADAYAIVDTTTADDSIYFAPQSAAIHLTATGGGSACRMTVPTRNPAILSLSPARCVQIAVDASDTLRTTFPQPGYLAGVWVTRNAVPAVALLR